MHRPGHYGAALVFYAPIALIASSLGFTSIAVLGGVVVTALAMIPDYDMRVPLIKHRGPTHTVWFALLMGFIGATTGGVLGSSAGILAVLGFGAFGFFIATTVVVSHIAADALTPMGVKPFAPVQTQKYTYNVAKASNPIANYVLLGIGVATTGGAIVIGIMASRFFMGL